MEDDAANFHPDGLLIGHALQGALLYLRFGGARDVSDPDVGVRLLRSGKNFKLQTGRGVAVSSGMGTP